MTESKTIRVTFERCYASYHGTKKDGESLLGNPPLPILCARRLFEATQVTPDVKKFTVTVSTEAPENREHFILIWMPSARYCAVSSGGDRLMDQWHLLFDASHFLIREFGEGSLSAPALYAWIDT